MTLQQMGAMLMELKAAVAGAPALAQENADLKVKLAAAEAANVLANAEVEKLKAAASAMDASVISAKAEADAKAKEAADAVAAKAAAEADALKAKADAEAKVKDLIDNPSKVAMEIAAKAGVKVDQLPKADAGKPAGPKGLAAVQAAIEAQIGKKN